MQQAPPVGDPEFRLFETRDLLSDVGAEAFQGRGTRVWRVREVVNGNTVGPDMVLKDCFINADHKREGDTLQEIIDSLAEDDKRRLHFLTVEVHGDVYVDNHLDNTDAIHHGKHCPSGSPCIDTGVIANELQPLARGHCVTPLTPNSGTGIPFIHPVVAPFVSSRSHQNRQHYRIVFKEVGTAVSELGNRQDMFLAIQGALAGMYKPNHSFGERLLWVGFLATEVMHSLGYVHRDISCGNVLLVERPGLSPSDPPKHVGVLTDLEYAIKLGSNLRAHHIRTGTPFFMACEVAANKYLALYGNAYYSGDTPPFCYNRLHGPLCVVSVFGDFY